MGSTPDKVPAFDYFFTPFLFHPKFTSQREFNGHGHILTACLVSIFVISSSMGAGGNSKPAMMKKAVNFWVKKQVYNPALTTNKSLYLWSLVLLLI